jgi:DNA-binding IclR family transcriptional regulator
MNKRASNDRTGINSIEVGLQVVKALVGLGRPAALGEVADAAKMHPAKVRRYMVSFIRSGLIMQSAETGHYDLGPYGLDFSLAYLKRMDASRFGASAINALVNQVNESAFIAVWGTYGATVIDWQAARRPISASTRIGTVFPLLTSTTGRTFLAYLPLLETEPFLKQELKSLSRSPDVKPTVERKDVNQIISEIRERGLARGIGLRASGMNSFSAPVFNSSDGIACTLTVFGYEETFDSSWDGLIAVNLKSAARILSQQMGHSYLSKPSEKGPTPATGIK